MGLVCNSIVDVLDVLGEMTIYDNDKIRIEYISCNFNLFILHHGAYLGKCDNVYITEHKIFHILLSPIYNKFMLEIIIKSKIFNFMFFPDQIKDIQKNKFMLDDEDMLFFNKSDLIIFIENSMNNDINSGVEYIKNLQRNYNSIFLNISQL